MARWQTMRRIHDSMVFAGNKDLALTRLMNVPDVDLYAIDVSFPKLADKALYEHLNNLPPSFVLPPEAIDRLGVAARTIILSSPEFQRLLKDSGAKLIAEPPATDSPAKAH